MTKVVYKHSKSGFEIEFCGHADYAPGGKDIVCAAVSVLASELLIAGERALQKGEISRLRTSAHSGYVCMRFRYEKLPCAMREVVLTVLACLENIALQYSENVALVKKP